MNQARPAIAIIASSCPPYRVYLHRRIAREVPQVRLLSAFTHALGTSPWELRADNDIGAVVFGPNESWAQQASPRFMLHEWRKGGRIIRWLGEQNVRAVIVLGYNDMGRLRIIRWCARHSVPLFLSGDSNIRADMARGMRAVVKKMLVSYVIRACDGVMPFGSLGMAYFRKYGARDDRMFLMPCEPDYELIHQIDNESIQAACLRFGLPRQRRRIVFCGRFYWEKRIDLLLHAFAGIAAQRPQWDLLLIGDGEERSALQQTVPEELRNRIVWTGFIDDQKTINALYHASDVLVLPADREHWALVINEAMAAGLAIISSDVVGAVPELVHDGINGRVFPRGDGEQLTQCLLDVTDPARIDAMKAASQKVLGEWRKRGDPVEGLRQALRSVKVIE